MLRRPLLLLLLVLLSCGTPPRPIPPSPPVTDAGPTPCDQARQTRQRIPQLLDEGKLHRTTVVLGEANAICPTEAHLTWADEVETLAELGRYTEARSLLAKPSAGVTAERKSQVEAKVNALLADRDKSFAATDEAKKPMREVYVQADRHMQQGLEAETQGDSPRADQENRLAFDGFLEAWRLWRPNGQALLQAGLLAKEKLHQPAVAQRLFDRALVELERFTGGAQVHLEVPDGFQGSTQLVYQGARVVVAHGRSVTVYAASSMRPALRFEAHETPVSALALSRRGLATGSFKGDLRLWDLSNGKVLRALSSSTPVLSLAVSPDGDTLVAGGMGSLRRWDLRNGQQLPALPGLRGSSASFLAVGYSQEGHFGAGSSDGVLRLWDPRGKELRSHRLAETSVTSFAFSPDGRVVAVGASDKTVVLFELRTGREVRRMQAASGVLSLGFSPNSEVLVTGAREGTLQVWDVATGQERVPGALAHPGGARSVAASLDGSKLLSAGTDASVRVGELLTGKTLYTLKAHSDAVRSLVFSPDRKLLASASEQAGVRLWDLGTSASRPLSGTPSKGRSVAFSPDGQLLASGSLDGTIVLWELGSGRQRPSLQGHRGPVEALAFSPTGDMLVSGGADGTARSWEVATGKALVTLGGLPDATSVLSVAFAPDGRVAIGSSDGTLRLWQPRGRASPPLWPQNAPVQAVAFSPDGQLLASAADGTVRLFGAYGREPRALGSASRRTSSLSFSTDGGLLAFGSEAGDLAVWEVSSGALVAAFPRVGGAVASVVFSPDGKVLFAASSDRRVHLWDVRGGQGLGVLVPVGNTQGGYLLHLRGLLDFVGAEARTLPLCVVGPIAVQLDVCEERFRVSGLLSKVLVMEPGYTPRPPSPPPENLTVDVVQIPGGTFSMGSEDGRNDEKPVHLTTVAAFALDRTEVTAAAYKACVDARRCTAPDTGRYCTWGKEDRGNHPINCVDWIQASVYCRWVGKRLPTESEWEYAARGSEGRKYPWGDTEPKDQLCWGSTSQGKTCAVGSFSSGRTPLGLEDMAGNVWEWTASNYCPYPRETCIDEARVARGGCWGDSYATSVRGAFRAHNGPGRRIFDLGFRCAR
jgi:WD40 repeat protein/formylglycine-generating enzyme required for sulfatase activity